MNGADACHQCSLIKGCAAGKNHNKKGIREVNSNQEKSPRRKWIHTSKSKKFSRSIFQGWSHLKVGAVEANSAAISEPNIERSAPTSETSQREREKPGTGVLPQCITNRQWKLAAQDRAKHYSPNTIGMLCLRMRLARRLIRYEWRIALGNQSATTTNTL